MQVEPSLLLRVISCASCVSWIALIQPKEIHELHELHENNTNLVPSVVSLAWLREAKPISGVVLENCFNSVRPLSRLAGKLHAFVL